MNKFPDCRTHASRPSCLGWVVWLLLITPQQGWAAGTPAGTTISNVATVGYSIGVVPQPDIPSAAVTFLVDEKINLTVAGGVTTSVASPSAAQATTFTVTNNSNSALDFSLAVTSAIPVGDNFDPTACSAFVESNAVPDGYQAGTDIATFIDELPADATETVYAVCDIPGTAVNSNTGLTGLTATALGNFNAAGYTASPGAAGAALVQTAGADTANLDIVFADAAGTEDLPRDAKHSAHNTYLIDNITLAIAKTVASVLDPNGTAVLMPGAVMTYQINVTLTGAGGTATTLVITDPLPADTTYVPGSISITCNSGTYSGGGACGTGAITPQPAVPKTDTNADADFADFTANTVSVSLGNVAAPANFVITFRATIN